MSQGPISNPLFHPLPLKDDMNTVFSLKRCNSSPTAPFIMVNFSLPKCLQSHPYAGSLNLVPTFNNDKKFYTPSFVLATQINKFISNDEGYRMIHEKKIQEMEQEHTEILVPKPSKANSYCCICRQPFEDYLTHINLGKHLQLMKKSPFYHLIDQICDQNGQSQTKSSSKKINQKTEDSTQSIAKKKKIIKIQSMQEPKRKRGRPRKETSNAKLQMLASIPTSVSISL